MTPRLLALLCGAVTFTVAANMANAHEIRPAIVTAEFSESGQYKIKVVANIEVLLAGIDPEHDDTRDAPEARVYNELRALEANAIEERFRAFAPRWLEGIEIEFDGIRGQPQLDRLDIPEPGNTALPRRTTIYLTGQTTPGTPAFTWRYAAAFGSSVLRVQRADRNEMTSYWLKDGTRNEPIPVTGAPARSLLDVFSQYLVLGFTHILPFGLDHILFVLGLYLLSTRLEPLLVQVTAFTVAHSITLGLGLYGVIALPASIVEPLIAASIVYIAAENFLTDKLTPWRPYVVVGFGLLHGLGFAGVLHEIGLARSDFVNGLIAFNIGVELGQIVVIAIAFLATGLWFRHRSWYRARIVRPASTGIGCAGAFWLVERII